MRVVGLYGEEEGGGERGREGRGGGREREKNT